MVAPINWQIAATNDPQGTALTNGTPVLVTTTTPNDGHYHMCAIGVENLVATTETGGAITLIMGSSSISLLAGALASGTYTGGAMVLVPPNTVVSVQQTSALSGGAATVVATIVVAQ